MALYMLQVAYTSGGIAALVANPQDRSEAVRAPIEKLGGKPQHFWFSFGEYDIVGIVEMSDNVSAAAFEIAAKAGGACKSVLITPLLSISEGLEALKKAGECGYKAPAAAAGQA
ncbi:MAG: GYD domain-containing protein [Bryobacteraceae bacterium]